MRKSIVKSKTNLEVHPDLVLAKRAAEARAKNLKTNNIRYLRQAIKLFTQAEEKARQSGKKFEADYFRGQASKLMDVFKEIKPEKK